MVQFLNNPGVLPSSEPPKNEFLSGMNNMLSQGLGYALQNMMEEKQYQKQQMRQRSINTEAATSLADNLQLKGPNRKSFIEQFSTLAPDKQVGALKNLAEAQMYRQYMDTQNPDEMQQEKQVMQGQQEAMGPSQQQGQQIPSQQKSEYNIQPQLPEKPKKYPPFGMTAQAAAIESKRYQADRNRADKETKEYRDAIDKQGEGAERSAQTLARLDKLIDSGKLANPVIAALAKKYDAVGLLSPESQLFEKTMGEFLPSMADTYGARVTNQHERIFLNTLPRLQQTDAGKKLLVSVLKKKNEADNIKYKIKQEILRETKGIPPLNIRDMVEERSQAELEKNYDDVLNIIDQGARRSAPKGTISMMDDIGTLYYIPEDQAENAMKKGLKQL